MREGIKGMTYSMYIAHHNWVRRHLGKPVRCKRCKDGDRKLHWANKSQKYLRDKFDWVSLCVPCHREFDRHVKFTRGKAKKIRNEYALGGTSQQKLADKYGVSRQAIVNAIQQRIKAYA